MKMSENVGGSQKCQSLSGETCLSPPSFSGSDEQYISRWKLAQDLRGNQVIPIVFKYLRTWPRFLTESEVIREWDSPSRK